MKKQEDGVREVAVSTVDSEEKAPDLRLLEIKPIYNWQEWLKLWRSANNLQWIESLLHFGFSVRMDKGEYHEKEYDYVDRIMFYLAIADGWVDNDLLWVKTDRTSTGEKYCFVGYDQNGRAIEKNLSEIRQQVARKAFDMLCLNFFKNMQLLGGGRGGDSLNQYWGDEIVTEKFFPIIRNFFRVEKGNFNDMVVRNLSCRNELSRNEEHAVSFLANLAKFLWTWEEVEINSWDEDDAKVGKKAYNAKMQLRIDSAKPWMIEVLYILGKLDILRKWILQLDETCLAKLKEIAMRSEIVGRHRERGRELRAVTTLEEACYAGSKAGWFLNEHELMAREHARLIAVLEAAEALEEAQKRVRELSKS